MKVQTLHVATRFDGGHPKTGTVWFDSGDTFPFMRYSSDGEFRFGVEPDSFKNQNMNFAMQNLLHPPR